VNTFSYGHSIGFQDDATYGGAAPQQIGTVLDPEYVQRLLRPDATNVILATISARQWMRGANHLRRGTDYDDNFPSLAIERCVKFAVDRKPTGVSLANGPTLTEVQFPADPNPTPSAGTFSSVLVPGTWAYSSAAVVGMPANHVYVSPPTGRQYGEGIFALIYEFYCATIAKSFRSKFWQPRLVSAPDVSIRIEPRWGGVGKIGGGTLALDNADGYFDQFDDLAWDGGQVHLEMGVDLPGAGGPMDESDYLPIGTWRIDGAERTDRTFTITLRELKTRLETRIPIERFTREDYPALDENDIDKVIPWAWGRLYGVKPVLLDAAAKRFKVAGHRIRSLDGVRIRIDDRWTESGFATFDLAKAEFTLGSDWEAGREVSVDFSGRINPDGTLMTNGADVMLDLLLYAGVNAVHSETFNRSRRILHLGYDRFGEEIASLSPAIYLNEQRTGLDVAGDLNRILNGSLFVDFDGLWRFVVFDPARGQDLGAQPGALPRRFSERDFGQTRLRRHVDASDVFSSIKVTYNRRSQDGFAESVIRRRRTTEYVHRLNVRALKEETLGVWRAQDATLWAERQLVTDGLPLVRYSFTLPRQGFFLLPADKIHVTDSRQSFDQILEVYEVSHSFLNNQVRVVAGNLRAWEDSFWFWAPDIGTGETHPALPSDGVFLKTEELSFLHGQRIDVWRDSNVGQHHASQSTVAQQPICLLNQINGHAAAQFTASAGTFLRLTGFTFQQLANAAEIFLVLRKLGSATAHQSIMGWGTNGPAAQRYLSSSNRLLEEFASTTLQDAGTPAIDVTSWHLYNIASQNGEFTIRHNGTTLFTTATNTFRYPGPGVGSSGTLYLGASPGFNIAGDVLIAEALIFNRVLTSSERSGAQKYVADKFLIAVSGAGALVPPNAWDQTWTNSEVRTRRQNFGYWAARESEYNSATGQYALTARETDKADEDDARSHFAGRWW
jgi:hypothetical protein